MEYLEFFLYGLIQGFTEFIPVSSTAHLKVISEFLGINDPGSSLSAIIQLGSVLALIWYFKNDIFKLKSKSSRKFFDHFSHSKLLKSIFTGTIPIVLLGFSVKNSPYFYNNFLRSNFSIALVSFIMAIFMYVAECSKKGPINLSNHKYTDSLLIGFSQAFAIFPGVSRSGVTISTALISGWERGNAAKYSFLLGIPSISLAAIVEFISSLNEFSSFGFLPLIVGITTTFLSSLLAIDFLLKYFSSNGLKLFIIYRVIFGTVILLNL